MVNDSRTKIDATDLEMKIEKWATSLKSPVFEPTECLTLIDSRNGNYFTSRSYGYRDVIRALKRMLDRGTLGKWYSVSTNQSVYWLTSRLK